MAGKSNWYTSKSKYTMNFLPLGAMHGYNEAYKWLQALKSCKRRTERHAILPRSTSNHRAHFYETGGGGGGRRKYAAWNIKVR